MSENLAESSGEKFAMGSSQEQTRWQEEYRRIIAEVSAHSAAQEQGVRGAELRTVGKPLPRNDAIYKVRGKARYAENITLPDTLYGCFVRSTEPHARLLSVDISEAEKAPGIVAILTAKDIDPSRELVGTHDRDTPVFARDKVRYTGEPVAAIAAETLEQAEAARELIEIEYDPLPEIFSPEEALAPGAELVDPEGPIITEHNLVNGDVEAGFKEADIVLEGVFTTEPIDHCFMEAQSGVAFVDNDGVLTLMVSTQYPHFHHKELAHVTGLPEEKIRVIQSVVGGAFGGKIDNTIEAAACLFALKTGRPVKMSLSREEVFTSTTKRHATQIRQRLGATRDGRFTALDIDMLFDGGAYRSYSRVVAGRCMIHSGLPYNFPNLRAHLLTTFTNFVPSGSMRSFGVVKMAFALEQQINELARKIGMSPIEIRRINGVRDGDSLSTGQVLQDVGLMATLDAIEPIYNRRKQELASEDHGALKRGLGIASLGYGIGYSGTRNPSTARLSVSADGVITTYTGTPDIGTGSDMALSQITAEKLGVSLHRIKMISGDSTKTDDSGPTSASRTTYFSGNAVCIAAIDFQRQFKETLSARLDFPADQIHIEDDRVIVGNEDMDFADACRLLGSDVEKISAYGKFDPDIEIDIFSFRGNPYPTYTYATHLIEIEVDEDLGSVDVVGIWAAQDGGVIINPVGAEGQVHGGFAQGLGMALWEKIIRENGYIANPNYRDYLLPGAKDMPGNFETTFVEATDRTGPYGAKGIAEASIIPIPGGIASALGDALGIRPSRLPMDSQYVFELIKARQSSERSETP